MEAWRLKMEQTGVADSYHFEKDQDPRCGFRIKVKGSIRIRMKVMRIRNPVLKPLIWGKKPFKIMDTGHIAPAYWIPIRIHWGPWICIRIRNRDPDPKEGKNDPQK
jgi:hypothetical protein